MRTSFDVLETMTGHDSVPASDRKRNPQAAAWAVLSAAFAVFWLLVAGVVLGGKHYYDTATVTANATLTVDGGIVLFRDSVTSTLINASNNLELREGDEVLVGQGARASVSLFDGSVVQLYSGSNLTLRELRKSRFQDSFARISVALNKGTARVFVNEPRMPGRQLSAITPFGSAELGVGSHGVDVTDTQARVSTREGTSSVTSRDGVANLITGQKAILAEDSFRGPLPEGDPLVRNGNFSQGFSLWNPIDLNEAGRPEEPGQRKLSTEKIGGRESIALNISRLSPRAIHNETGLSQPVNMDVSDYQSLKLRADVKVTGQSLSGGGYMGYEYPLMIRVRYRDATGGQIDWTHGFFVTNPESRPTPNGEEVPRGEWISYDGDLMQVSPRPMYVVAVEVLGAGHTFDGSVANLDLVGK